MVPELTEITAVEDEYARPTGKPRLGDAYDMLKSRWQAGHRDLETGLRLMFLAWYACSEPPFLTGLPTEEDTSKVFQEIFFYFGGSTSTDPELLYTVALMCNLFPYCCGSEEEWFGVGSECLNRAQQLKPAGFAAEHFEGRGAYGAYFAHMARNGGWPVSFE